MGCASSRRNANKEKQKQKNKRNNQNSPQHIGSYQVVTPYIPQIQRHTFYPGNQRMVFPNFGQNDVQTRRRQFNMVYQIPQFEGDEQAQQQMSETLTQIERNQQIRRNHPSQQRMHSQQEQLQILFYLFRLLRTSNSSNDRINMLLFLRLLQVLGTSSEFNGLDNQQISRLKNCQAKNNQMTCSICQDLINVKQQIIILPCTHQYHTQCIKPWLQKSDKCPMCRKSVREPN